jgi:hypothetical protein
MKEVRVAQDGYRSKLIVQYIEAVQGLTSSQINSFRGTGKN